MKKSLEHTESVDVRDRDSPEKSPPKRGRPASCALKTTRASSSSLDQSPSPARPAPSKKPRHVEAATSKAGPSKVNGTPSMIARTQRSAATKATNKLHIKIMPDVMNFQKELKSGNIKCAYDMEQASAKAKGKRKEKGWTAVAVPAQKKKRISMGDGEPELSAWEPEKKKRKTGKGNGRKSDVIELSVDENVLSHTTFATVCDIKYVEIVFLHQEIRLFDSLMCAHPGYHFRRFVTSINTGEELRKVSGLRRLFCKVVRTLVTYLMNNVTLI